MKYTLTTMIGIPIISPEISVIAIGEPGEKEGLVMCKMSG